jgi:hypothetical protein
MARGGPALSKNRKGPGTLKLFFSEGLATRQKGMVDAGRVFLRPPSTFRIAILGGLACHEIDIYFRVSAEKGRAVAGGWWLVIRNNEGVSTV